MKEKELEQVAGDGTKGDQVLPLRPLGPEQPPPNGKVTEN